MRLLLVRLKAPSGSMLEAEAASSMGILLDLEGNKFGRRAAGIYMGRVCRAWCALGEVGVEEAELGLVDSLVSMGEI